MSVFCSSHSSRCSSPAVPPNPPPPPLPSPPKRPPAEAAQQYTAEIGQLLQNESRPYLSLMLRDERAY